MLCGTDHPLEVDKYIHIEYFSISMGNNYGGCPFIWFLLFFSHFFCHEYFFFCHEYFFLSYEYCTVSYEENHFSTKHNFLNYGPNFIKPV